MLVTFLKNDSQDGFVQVVEEEEMVRNFFPATILVLEWMKATAHQCERNLDLP